MDGHAHINTDKIKNFSSQISTRAIHLYIFYIWACNCVYIWFRFCFFYHRDVRWNLENSCGFWVAWTLATRHFTSPTWYRRQQAKSQVACMVPLPTKTIRRFSSRLTILEMQEWCMGGASRLLQGHLFQEKPEFPWLPWQIGAWLGLDTQQN